MELRKVAASNGWRWLVDGFGIFRRSPLIWIVFGLSLYFLVQVTTSAAMLGVLLLLFYPAILAGPMIGCADLERGRQPQIGHLIAGFRKNPVHLTTIGGVYLIGQIVIMWVMALIGGEQMQQIVTGHLDQSDPQAIAAAMRPIMMALLVGTVLSVPLLMAIWFSPLLVVFEDLRPLQAMKLSIAACWKNIPAFSVYGLIVVVLMALAMAPFRTANPQLNPGIWIATVLVLPSIYASYRDIFGNSATRATTPV